MLFLLLIPLIVLMGVFAALVAKRLIVKRLIVKRLAEQQPANYPPAEVLEATFEAEPASIWPPPPKEVP